MNLLYFSSILLLFSALTSFAYQDDIQYVDTQKFLCMFPNQKLNMTSHDSSLEDKLALLNKAMHENKINRRQRVIHFLVQSGVETDNYTTFIERGSDDRCKNYDGGCRYKGRGPLQIRHKRNYQSLSSSLSHDFVNRPDDLLKDEFFFSAPARLWNDKELNKFSDIGNLTQITERLLEGLPLQLERRKMLLKWIDLCMSDTMDVPIVERCGFTYTTDEDDNINHLAIRYSLFPNDIKEKNPHIDWENITHLEKGIKLYIPKCW